jgi:hypothetical protein
VRVPGLWNPELEFLKSLWGLGTEEEEGYRTGPPGYIGWRIPGPHTRLKIRAQLCVCGSAESSSACAGLWNPVVRVPGL